MESADATDLLGTQSHVAGINISVFENSGNKDAAIDFVKHLTSDSEQVYLNQSFSSLPVVTSAYDDPAFQSDTIKLKQVTLESVRLGWGLAARGSRHVVSGRSRSGIPRHASQYRASLHDGRRG